MDYLDKIPTHKTDVQMYKLTGNGSKLTRYIATTPETRIITNQPEIFGMTYTRALTYAVQKTLEALPEAEQFKQWPDYEANAIVLLRGGLNYGLRNALRKAYGYNKHSTTFIVSQRSKNPETNEWNADVQTYKQITIPKVVSFFLGDVIGTGTSIKKSLAALTKLMEEVNVRTVRKFVVLTLGCSAGEHVLEEYDTYLRKTYPDYEGMVVVYFEGRFTLATTDMNIKLIDPGTDFLRVGALLAPEFLLMQYDQVYYPLEKCTNYDAGNRAFDILLYKREVQEYWARMLQEANNGFTLYDALLQRFPDHYDTKEQFFDEKKKQWKNVSEGLINQIWLAHQQRWNSHFIEYAKTTDALKKICMLRLEMIQNHEC
ncbi:MAG: hypothetical protein WC254_01110 [Candidatus Woesearchaeota archaeon]|jgi:hypothetical protein